MSRKTDHIAATSLIHSGINNLLLKWINQGMSSSQGFFAELTHLYSPRKEQSTQMIDFYNVINNPVNHKGATFCDWTFLSLCREKIKTPQFSRLPNELKQELEAELTKGEKMMKDQLFVLLGGLIIGFLGSQSTIFTIVIAIGLAALCKDMAKMSMAFDFLSKLGVGLEALAEKTAHEQLTQRPTL
jgi:hypothetical protein